MITLKQGAKAYFDSSIGLIACKVLRIAGISGLASTAQTVTVRLTANSRPVVMERTGDVAAYLRGQQITTNGLHAIPRDAVRRRKYGTRILPYSVEVSCAESGQVRST